MTILFTKVVTMSEMKCPICQNNLHKINIVVSTCTNDKCKLWGSSIPNLVLETLAQVKQDLERTRNALDIATGFIKGISQTVINDCDNLYVVLGNFKKFAEDTLNQIKTALEQKDK